MNLGSNALSNQFLSSGPDMADVLLKGWPQPSQRVSYATGDEGDRVQNGWYDYTAPVYPAAVSDLDFTSANFHFLLKNDVKVGGVSNKTRFVDVDGGQTFSATGSKNLALIDKFSGLMFTRVFAVTGNWTQSIANGLAYSATINGVTYSDWYLPTLQEYITLFGIEQQNANFVDTVSGVTLVTLGVGGGHFISATTLPSNTAYAATFASSNKGIYGVAGGNTAKAFTLWQAIFVRDARALISAP